MAQAAYHVTPPLPPVEPRLNENGTGIEDVHPVPYMIDSGPAKGTRGVVKVPHSQYTPENVKNAVEADVNAHHQVAAIAQA